MNNAEVRDIKEFLDEKVAQYNNINFIQSDPLFVPHQFSRKEDIEIAGFLAATLAWGSRPVIIRNALRLISMMGGEPYGFLMHFRKEQLDAMGNFAHRTFNGVDARFFMHALRHIYAEHGGLEGVFTLYSTTDSVFPAIQKLNEIFFSLPHQERTQKHIANPSKGSAAKRLNMFLRWMVRRDRNGVDFGLWKNISPSVLSCPLDVHSGNVARKLGLLTRVQNDLRAVQELDANLRHFDPKDPVKYDFALFGLGVFEGF